MAQHTVIITESCAHKQRRYVSHVRSDDSERATAYRKVVVIMCKLTCSTAMLPLAAAAFAVSDGSSGQPIVM
jgi:hypothetical protein